MANYKAKLPKITTFIFDFDGVMSDGRVWLVDEENQIRNTNVKDGYALHHAVKKGYHVAVISGGKGHSLHMRMSFLGVKDVFTQDEVMRLSGVAACPADAAVEIQEIADYISGKKGGDGCVRDVIEQVMRVRGDWFDEASLHW